MNLNLGCGEHVAPGWCNIDRVIRTEGVDVLADVRALPFRDVERIYAGHLVEHLYPSEAEEAIRHWLEVLRPGGLLGILVPDIQRMWRIFVSGGFTQEAMDGAIGGERDPKDPYALHVTVWTIAQLRDFVSRITERDPLDMALEDWPAVADADWQVGVTVRK